MDPTAVEGAGFRVHLCLRFNRHMFLRSRTVESTVLYEVPIWMKKVAEINKKLALQGVMLAWILRFPGAQYCRELNERRDFVLAV